jgi:NitT/TauT family transport system ATP-binding protein
VHSDLMVLMEDVHVAFELASGEVEALRGFSLKIRNGEVVAMVGPSGCGKTTILRVMAGLLEPNRGVVEIAGISPTEAKDRRLISFMFQKPALLPWMNVRENVQLPGMVAKDSEAMGRADSLIRLVGLSGFEEALPSQLSGGMQSRVALARALSLKTRLLLMDEPFGALDDLTRSNMQDESLSILSNSGKTIVFVTHSIDEAVYMSDRVIVLSQRPASIILDIPVELPKPRDWRIKDDPLFLTHRTLVKEALSGRSNTDRSRAQGHGNTDN